MKFKKGLVFLFVFLNSIFLSAKVPSAVDAKWQLGKLYPVDIEECYEALKDGVILSNDENSKNWTKFILFKERYFLVRYQFKLPVTLYCVASDFKRAKKNLLDQFDN